MSWRRCPSLALTFSSYITLVDGGWVRVGGDWEPPGLVSTTVLVSLLAGVPLLLLDLVFGGPDGFVGHA
jgi:hypothetical protein